MLLITHQLNCLRELMGVPFRNGRFYSEVRCVNERLANMKVETCALPVFD